MDFAPPPLLLSVPSFPSNMSGPSTDILYELSPIEKRTFRFGVTGNSIITGGCSYLGLEVARALLEHGASGVSLFDANPDRSYIAVNQLRCDFPSAKIVTQRIIIFDEYTVRRAVAETVAELKEVNMLLCLAGIDACNRAVGLGPDEWSRILDMNADSSWLCARAVAMCMIHQGVGGSIVFTASISAHSINCPVVPPPIARSRGSSIPSRPSKSSIAAEWGKYGIRVNSISPGYMSTICDENVSLEEARRRWSSRKLMGRIDDPSELIGIVVLLCSQGGKYINGADILVESMVLGS
ncbi:hypothetical protein BJ138DRAFT_1097723 [Hygrophoropsis aurantiaca]|uniref:Uncharacterized protein n=1 Tax=Hygrophoropsis aurantiaca TaxID=72124 RepID=A0ACB8AQS6_9AGAM|nr:hypothetical protein BJ138DRAFT_1097723 [Hygrophoropsis aurantiaca]